MSDFHTLKRVIRMNPDQFRPLKKNRWFITWLKDNMHIYEAFHKYAIDLRVNGCRKYYSARSIIHRMRWDTYYREAQPSKFKVQDHCTPYLARLVMLTNPQLKGMFSIKGGSDE